MQESVENSTTELEERLRFETLLADISTRFINLSAGQIDGKIESALQDIEEGVMVQLFSKFWWSLLLERLYLVSYGFSSVSRLAKFNRKHGHFNFINDKEV